MGIFLRQSHNVKPLRWGSPADVQYAIRINSEKIYDCDPDHDVLVMPLFWGLPLLDYSGYNNHGTNYGATYKDGSLEFDGTDDYVDIGTISGASIGANPRTISLWFNADTFDISYNDIIFSYISNVGSGRDIFIYAEDNAVSVGFNGHRVITPKSALSINTWYYVNIVVPSGASVTGDVLVYINGQNQSLSNEAGSSITLNTAATNAKIATDVTGGYNFNGLIDEVRISNVARATDPIALFHDRPWDLYQRVSRPVWSIPTPPVGAIINQFQSVNLGADLFNGTLL